LTTTRVDQWLWAVRLFKTRSAATDACRAGHVRVNGNPAKAAQPVRDGDRIEAFVHGRQRDLEVVRVIDKRVAATVAAECLVDHSPPPPPKEDDVAWFARDPGAGRPTKRDRRTMDRFRRGSS
jgi:ribosome-associated heat shock protein Hsp15